MPNNPQDVHLSANIMGAVETPAAPAEQINETPQPDLSDLCMLQVEIPVADIDKMTKYYTTVLDLPQDRVSAKVTETMQSTVIHLPYGRIKLTVDPEKASKPHYIAVTFIIGSEDGVNDVYRKLKTIGMGRVLQGPYFDRENRYTVTAEDAEGNVTSFAE